MLDSLAMFDDRIIPNTNMLGPQSHQATPKRAMAASYPSSSHQTGLRIRHSFRIKHHKTVQHPNAEKMRRTHPAQHHEHCRGSLHNRRLGRSVSPRHISRRSAAFSVGRSEAAALRHHPLEPPVAVNLCKPCKQTNKKLLTVQINTCNRLTGI